MNTGDKVICINDIPPLNSKALQHKHWIKKDETYTIRAIRKLSNNQVGILLEEIINPLVFDNITEVQYEPGYNINRFRSLDELDIIEQEMEFKELIEQ